MPQHLIHPFSDEPGHTQRFGGDDQWDESPTLARYTDDIREQSGFFADKPEPHEPYDGYKKLAAVLIEECLNVLAAPRPQDEPPGAPKARRRWEREWATWIENRRRELHFVAGSNFIVFCEAAGLDANTFLTFLRSRDLLYDPVTVAPDAIKEGWS